MKKRTLIIKKPFAKKRTNTGTTLRCKDMSFESSELKDFISYCLSSKDWSIGTFSCILELIGIDKPIHLYSQSGNSFYGKTDESQRTLKFTLSSKEFSVTENGVTNTYSINRRYLDGITLQLTPTKKIIRKDNKILTCLYGDSYHYSLKSGPYVLDINKGFDLSLPNFTNTIEEFLLSLDPKCYLYDVTTIYQKLKRICQKHFIKFSNKRILMQTSREFPDRMSFVASQIVLNSNGKLTNLTITSPEGDETYMVSSNGDWKWGYFQGLSELSYCSKTENYNYSTHGALHLIETAENPSVILDRVLPEIQKLQKNLAKKF